MALGNANISMDPTVLGNWQTIGYNKCFEISTEQFCIHDLSSVSCVRSKKGSAQDFYRVFERLECDPAGKLHFYTRGGITRYTLQPLSQLPDECKPSTYRNPPDPEFNFDVFWHYFKENYAFFELRQMDWEQVYRSYRPKVNPLTSDQELAGILTDILRELNDSHATLEIPGQKITTRKPHALIRQWQSEFQSDEFLELYPRGIPKLFEALNSAIFDGKGRSALHGQLLWGKINPRIGYLCVFSMMDMYADFSLLHYAGFEVTNLAYLHALGMAIDQALADLSDAQALVLDVRFNPGGHDAAGKVIASRFVDRKHLAFTKQAYDKNGLTTPQEIFIEPDGKAHFPQQVLLLTSEATASAAEVFVHFMMPLPQVTRLGGATRGVLSDMLLMRLPNGWTTSISNEVYTAANGVCYESSGIPPQIEATTFYPNDFYGKLKCNVEEAIAIIERRLI